MKLMGYKKDRAYLWAKAMLMLLLVCAEQHSWAQDTQADWKTRLTNSMPLLGHRNWILVVDSAYPLQTTPGIEVIETNSHELAVVRTVLDTINSSKHVRPQIMLDSELPFVPEQDSPGVTAYREQIGKMLQGYEIQSQLHETILRNMSETAKTFHVLVLKTNMTIPYSSVFIRLDCKYWSADQERRLRAKMRLAKPVRN